MKRSCPFIDHTEQQSYHPFFYPLSVVLVLLRVLREVYGLLHSTAEITLAWCPSLGGHASQPVTSQSDRTRMALRKRKATNFFGRSERTSLCEEQDILPEETWRRQVPRAWDFPLCWVTDGLKEYDCLRCLRSHYGFKEKGVCSWTSVRPMCL